MMNGDSIWWRGGGGGSRGADLLIYESPNGLSATVNSGAKIFLGGPRCQKCFLVGPEVSEFFWEAQTVSNILGEGGMKRGRKNHLDERL